MTALLPVPAEPQHFSLAEQIAFAALVLGSIYVFWRRFSVVLNRIIKSKKDLDFHLFPLWPRLRDFLSEVMLQSKVVRRRVAAG